MIIRVSDFLTAFFPELDEPIQFRAFKAKGAADSEDNGPVTFRTTRRELAEDKEVQSRVLAINKTRGIYFIPNAGGNTDAAITRYNAIFCERDDISIDEQNALLDSSPLATSIRVETLKSVHAYWLVEGDCSESQWRELQARLIAHFRGDPTVKNPSRVMRLPNLNHVSLNGDGGLHYKRVETREFYPERRYTVEALLAAFPPVVEARQSAKRNGRPQPVSNYATWDALWAEWGRRLMAHPSAHNNGAGNWDCQGLCHDGKGATGLVYFPARNRGHCNKGCDESAVLAAFGLPDRPDGAETHSTDDGQTTINPLDPLRALASEPSPADIEAALRQFAALLVSVDALAREMARDQAIKILKGCGCSGPARLVDAVLPSEKENGKANDSNGLGLRDPDPWPEPVDGAALLDEIASSMSRFVSMTTATAEAVALWVVYSHAYDLFDVAPLLAITSPEKRCGKTTLLTLLGALVPRPLSISNITSSALFRTVEKYHPTLLIDEADSFLTDNEELRGILNSGHRRSSAYVIRTTGDEHEPQLFTTWCPKAIALIGSLPATLEDRAMLIKMQRKRLNESVARLRFDRLKEFEHLRRRAAAWVSEIADQLRLSDPDIPDEIQNDRARDNWRPLLAIADAAGRDWPQRARDAARELGATVADSESARTLILGDLKAIFEERGDKLTSEEIIQALVEMESRPWAEWRSGKPISKVGLARLLRPFGIQPVKWREGEITQRGYQREDFGDTFARYLGIESPQSPHGPESTTYSEIDSPQSTPFVASSNGPNPLKTKPVATVATRIEEVARLDADGSNGGRKTFSEAGICPSCGSAGLRFESCPECGDFIR
ncbi:MAG: DUF3631 domain-containing protein [Acidobacteriota bacterium]